LEALGGYFEWDCIRGLIRVLFLESDWSGPFFGNGLGGVEVEYLGEGFWFAKARLKADIVA
jgi:hypothetical protein